MEDMISIALVFLIVIVTVGLVIGLSNPIIQTTTKSADIRGAESDLISLDNYIRTVVREGKDSTRVFNFESPKTFTALAGEDAIQFRIDQTNFIDYLTRTASGDLVYVAGSNVDCTQSDGNGDGVTDLVAENDKLKAVFRMDNGRVDTTNILEEALQKSNGDKIYIGNFSIAIDGDGATANGTGYTEILTQGRNLPACTIHAYVNSTIQYDVYYKLYAGADFLVVEVRHIR